MTHHDNSLLYKDRIDTSLRALNDVLRTEALLPKLTSIIESMRCVPEFQYLLDNPYDEHGRSCFITYVKNNTTVPMEMVAKLFSIITARISLSPSSTSFVTQTYKTKVILNNLQPPTKITNITLQARQDTLLREIERATTYKTQISRIVPSTIRLRLEDSLLKRCVNAMGDLSEVISHGHLANNFTVDDYISTNMLK